MQDMKTGEGGLLQVTLEGINLKFMHNQVGTSNRTRLLAQCFAYNKISFQALNALPVSKGVPWARER